MLSPCSARFQGDPGCRPPLSSTGAGHGGDACIQRLGSVSESCRVNSPGQQQPLFSPRDSLLHVLACPPQPGGSPLSGRGELSVLGPCDPPVLLSSLGTIDANGFETSSPLDTGHQTEGDRPGLDFKGLIQTPLRSRAGRGLFTDYSRCGQAHSGSPYSSVCP